MAKVLVNSNAGTFSEVVSKQRRMLGSKRQKNFIARLGVSATVLRSRRKRIRKCLKMFTGHCLLDVA